MADVPAPQKRRSVLTRSHIAGRDREFFATNLAVLLKAAIPVGEALESLEKTARARSLKKALHELQEVIDDGVALSKAVASSGLVSRQTLALIVLGEQSGKLVENLVVAAQQEQKQRLFRSKLLSALLYPAFVLGLTVIVGLGIAWFILPKLSQTFSQLHVHLPLVSRVLIGIGNFLKANGIWAVPSVLALIFGGVILLVSVPAIRSWGLRVALRMPGIGRLLQELEIARFGYLLGTLLDAGLPITRALPLLAQATTLVPYERLYTYLTGRFSEGYNFKDSFAAYPAADRLLPPAIQQMIIAGERSGSLSAGLATIGSTYDEKVTITTQNFEALVEPILLVIVWLGVMMVAIAVILPIYSLVGGLQ